MSHHPHLCLVQSARLPLSGRLSSPEVQPGGVLPPVLQVTSNYLLVLSLSPSLCRVQCSADHLVNPNNIYHILQNTELRKSSSYHEAVQLKPQHVKLSLRVNEAHELDFHYEQAVDYPVDLYYLMDLSKSMEDDKEKLSTLGDLLSETMQNLTSNFRLGFGSFVDKVVMPYVSTVPRKVSSRIVCGNYHSQ